MFTPSGPPCSMNNSLAAAKIRLPFISSLDKSSVEASVSFLTRRHSLKKIPFVLDYRTHCPIHWRQLFGHIVRIIHTMAEPRIQGWPGRSSANETPRQNGQKAVFPACRFLLYRSVGGRQESPVRPIGRDAGMVLPPGDCRRAVPGRYRDARLLRRQPRLLQGDPKRRTADSQHVRVRQDREHLEADGLSSR